MMLVPSRWADDGACLSENPDIFHPTNNSYAYARHVCVSRCPVRMMCLVSALQAEATNPQDGRHGMFGGFGPNERQGIHDMLQEKGWSRELIESLVARPPTES